MLLLRKPIPAKAQKYFSRYKSLNLVFKNFVYLEYRSKKLLRFQMHPFDVSLVSN